jgi:hypothetical protein
MITGTPYQAAAENADTLRAARAVATDEQDVLRRLRVVEWDGHGEPLTEAKIRGDMTVMLSQPGVKRLLVIIDPLQKLDVYATTPTEDGQEERRRLTDLEADEERMRMLMRILAWYRNDSYPEGHPILAVSGLRKADGGRQRISKADVRGRSELVYDANAVLLLEPDAAAASVAGVTPVTLKVAKARDGFEGEIPLDYHHPISTFRERNAVIAASIPGEEGAAGATAGSPSSRFAGSPPPRRRPRG